MAVLIRASVTASPASSVAITPSRMIRTRSHRVASSSTSVELTTTAAPDSATLMIWRCSSAFAPTSTPWVGSSSSSTRGASRSHLPSSTFCWLPPLKLANGFLTPSTGRTWSWPNQCAASAPAARRLSQPLRQNGLRAAIVRLVSASSVMNPPPVFRSGGR